MGGGTLRGQMVFPINYPWESLRTPQALSLTTEFFFFFLFNCKNPSLCGQLQSNQIGYAQSLPVKEQSTEFHWALTMGNVLPTAARQEGCGDRGGGAAPEKPSVKPSVSD